jgi:hypothetical protein
MIKSLKPIEQYDFNFFKDNVDIFSFEKIKDVYENTLLDIDNNDSYSIKANNFLVTYFKVKDRGSKLDRI